MQVLQKQKLASHFVEPGIMREAYRREIRTPDQVVRRNRHINTIEIKCLDSRSLNFTPNNEQLSHVELTEEVNVITTLLLKR
jgi:hypothetical protein